MTTNAKDGAGPTGDGMVAALEASMRGPVIDPDHPHYEEARRVWNGLIDRRPAVVARCAGTADVVEAVRVARQFRPVVTIRGGGHQAAGSAVQDDALVIDLSAMKGIHVDPAARTARVQAGVTWGELDRETQLFGLATPGGEVSMTGVAGLTLGGGMGVLQRRHGLSCDNLRSIEIVTADGVVRTASRHEHPDLFWAARGGGRGIGVVTSFEFELHELGPEVPMAQVIYPYDQAEEVLRRFAEMAATAPDTISPEAVLWSIPPDPELPEELHGTKALFVVAVHAGPPAEAESALAPLGQLGTPLVAFIGPRRYVEIQSDVDALVPDGIRAYMKSHFTDGLSDEAIATIVEWDAGRPTPESLIAIRTLGGAVSKVGPDESAYAHRSAFHNVSFDAFWDDPALDGPAVAWARGAWDATAPFSTGGVYVNFSGFDDEADGLRQAVQGDHQARLERVRRDYDPEGVFAAAAAAP